MASLNTHRKVLQISPTSNSTSNDDPTIQTCLNYCNSQSHKNHTTTLLPYSGFCPKVCLAICPSLCHYSFSNLPLPSNFTPSIPNKPHSNHSPLLISMLILLAISFLLITFYFLYNKLYFHFYATNPRPNSRPSTRENNSLDHSHRDRVIFHPFWFISTVGLPTTVIHRIAVVKYGKEMEEKDCAVCLAEFEEGEDLRVLPKCRHAFHLLCIDTWLSSHTTCPLCRAPISLPDHIDDQSNRMVENSSSSVEVIVENNSLDGDLGGNHITTTREEVVDDSDNLEYCVDNLRRVDNKPSFSQRWTLEKGASNLLSRSLSCSGNIFSSSCNRPFPTS